MNAWSIIILRDYMMNCPMKDTPCLLHAIIDLLGFHLRMHALRVTWSYICQVKLKRKVLHNGD